MIVKQMYVGQTVVLNQFSHKAVRELRLLTIFIYQCFNFVIPQSGQTGEINILHISQLTLNNLLLFSL